LYLRRVTVGHRQQAHRSARIGLLLLCDVRQGTRPWRKVRIENLSPGGFRIAWFPDVRPELPLRIRIPGMQLLSARIVWQNGKAVGCEFREPLHVAVFEHVANSARVS
jgi:hypothetical protein